jgi:hypothetical protein
MIVTFAGLPARCLRAIYLRNAGCGGQEKVLGKSSRKVVGGVGCRSSYMRRTGNGHGAGLTPEGTAVRHPRRNLMGRRQDPGLEQGGVQSGVLPAGRKADGDGVVPGCCRGRRTGTSPPDGAGPGGSRADARGDGGPGPAGKRNQAGAGNREGGSRASGRSGAIQGRCRAGAGPSATVPCGLAAGASGGGTSGRTAWPGSPAANRAADQGKAARPAVRAAVRGWRLRGAAVAGRAVTRGPGGRPGGRRPRPRVP